jgi:chemosensory pili system protein ChpA (sensor histidine kinase/response regulator)
MSGQVVVDAAILTWIVQEVGRSLDEATDALMRWVAEPTERAALGAARKPLAQVRGALEIAGVRGVPRVVQEIHSLLHDVDLGSTAFTASTAALCTRAFAAMRGYLSELHRGEPEQPLKLASIHQEMLTARGAQRIAELDLFYLDCSPLPPGPNVDVAPEAAVAAAREQRARYQQGMLAWLRGDASGLARMREAIGRVDASQANAQARQPWWIAAGFLDLLAAPSTPHTSDAKRVCAAIDQQLRRSAEGTIEAPEELLREMLYFLCIGQPATERIVQIKQLYGLDSVMPGLRGGLEMVDVRAVEELRGKARLLKSLWEKAVNGAEPGQPAAFRELIGQLSQESMPFAPLAVLTGMLRDTAESLYASPPPSDSAISIEMATALLLLENTLTAWSESDPQLDQRVAAAGARLAAAVRGDTDPAAARVSLQSEALRESEAKAIRAEVAAQVLASLSAAQTSLEQCFSAAAPHDLSPVGKALRQIRGALVILDQPQAALVAERCGDAVEALQEGRIASAAQQQELACVLSALYVFAERLGVGSAEFEEIMQRAQVAPRWYREAGDLASEEPTAALQPAPEAAASNAAQGAIDVPGDPELLAIFLEEADEVLATVAQNLALLRERLDNAAALGTIRRSFHPLKGSGRMVSLTHLGEAAWDVERLLNDWVQQNRPATVELVDFLQAAQALQAGCLDELRRTARAHVKTDELAQWAQRLKRGDGQLGEPSAPARPSEADAGASLPQQPAAAPGDPTVQIGSVRLSPALYATYLAESSQRLASVEALFAELAAAPERGVPADLTRHVHSLSGISGTAGLLDVRALAAALERLLELLPRDEIAATLDPLHRAIGALAGMVAAVRALQVPQSSPELVAELELIAELMELRRPAARAEAAAADAMIDVTDAGSPIPDLPEAAASASAVPVERRHNRLDDDIDQQMLPVFLEEAAELVPQVGRDLRDWRADPASRLIPESLKRLLHTLKGSARMVGAMAIGELTHAMETRVVNVGQLSSIPDSLFEELEASFDRITLLVEELEKGTPAPGQAAGAQDSTSLTMAALDSTLHGRTLHGRTMHTTLHARTLHGRTLVTAMSPGVPLDQPAPEQARLAAEVRPARALLRVRAELVDRMVNEAGEVAIAQSRILGEMRSMRAALKELTDNIIRLRGQAREMEIQAETQMQSRMGLAQQLEEQFDPLEFDRFTRLQELTRFVSESINDVASVQQNLMKNVDEADAALLAQRRVARSLQDQLMGVRLVPFSSLSDRLYRVARLTAREAGKRVNVDIQGAQVELDRSVLERIAAPLEHLLRNAIVHGIEAPETRRAAGKAETGEVGVQVRQEGNEVVVTFSDDGRGLDLARIREKALSLGLLGADAGVADAELAQIIFTPGFSTAAQVSQAAGRGVGLDVVRSEITDLGGRVEVSFAPQRGTTFMVYLPLTLAVMQALLVRSGGQLFALPTLMIENVQKVRDDELARLYEAGETLWQERRYPLCHLQHLLADPQYVPRLRRYNAVVLMRSGPLRVAIHVDEFVGNQEIVVKNIGVQLTRVTGIAGAAVIGNGDSVLIINPVVLGDRAGARGRPLPAAATNATLHGKTMIVRAAPTVMVVDDSLTVRRITGRLLAREGYAVVEARDGVEALEKLQSAVPDVMLLDIEMPRMDGFELTRRLRGDGRFRSLPIIMITSRTADKHRTLAMELGVNVYLGKPYQEEELLAPIGGFVRASAQGAQR